VGVEPNGQNSTVGAFVFFRLQILFLYGIDIYNLKIQSGKNQNRQFQETVDKNFCGGSRGLSGICMYFASFQY
jgi:hypothetical protein